MGCGASTPKAKPETKEIAAPPSAAAIPADAAAKAGTAIPADAAVNAKAADAELDILVVNVSGEEVLRRSFKPNALVREVLVAVAVAGSVPRLSLGDRQLAESDSLKAAGVTTGATLLVAFAPDEAHELVQAQERAAVKIQSVARGRAAQKRVKAKRAGQATPSWAMVESSGGAVDIHVVGLDGTEILWRSFKPNAPVKDVQCALPKKFGKLLRIMLGERHLAENETLDVLGVVTEATLVAVFDDPNDDEIQALAATKIQAVARGRAARSHRCKV